MNNDKPKQDDDWAMSNPNVDLKKELEAEGFTDRKNPPKAAETADEDWGVTTPNTNLAEHIPPSEDYGQTAPNVNLSNEDWTMDAPKIELPKDDWTIDAPKIELPTAPPSEDWTMDAPTADQTADTDKTAPNINLPQANFDSSMPYIPPSRENKRGEGWQMPQPVFRVSTGEKTSTRMTQTEFESNDEQTDFSSNQAVPNLNSAQVAPQSAPMPEAQTAAAPVTKKRSKLPLILGGLFTFLFISVAALAGVWFMFLRGGGETASISSNTAPKSTPADTSSNAPTNSSANTPVSATKTPSNLPKEIDVKGKMVLVSAGSFTMGSNTGEETSKPEYQIDLPAFYIDQTEVTNAQYKEFCDATGQSLPKAQYWNENYFSARPNAPVVGISFEDAKAYAAWAGKRLPTEAEWEKAASWNDASKTKFEFPWGNSFIEANAAFGISELADVGKYPSGASPSGAMDMAGNAAEWVDSFFKPYPNSTAKDENFGDKNRVVRGGIFNAKTNDRLKTTKRIWIPPNFVPSGETASYIGFRCAISADDSRVKEILSK